MPTIFPTPPITSTILQKSNPHRNLPFNNFTLTMKILSFVRSFPFLFSYNARKKKRNRRPSDPVTQIRYIKWALNLVKVAFTFSFSLSMMKSKSLSADDFSFYIFMWRCWFLAGRLWLRLLVRLRQLLNLLHNFFCNLY